MIARKSIITGSQQSCLELLESGRASRLAIAATDLHCTDQISLLTRAYSMVMTPASGSDLMRISRASLSPMGS